MFYLLLETDFEDLPFRASGAAFGARTRTRGLAFFLVADAFLEGARKTALFFPPALLCESTATDN
jgi:hypothetical protein